MRMTATVFWSVVSRLVSWVRRMGLRLVEGLLSSSSLGLRVTVRVTFMCRDLLCESRL